MRFSVIIVKYIIGYYYNFKENLDDNILFHDIKIIK